MERDDCPPPSSGSKWWWSLQAAALFVLIVLPFSFGRNVFGVNNPSLIERIRRRYSPSFGVVLAHAGLFLVGVRALMELPVIT